MERLERAQAIANNHIANALRIADDPADRERLQRLAGLVTSYIGVVGKLAMAAKEYGETAEQIKATTALGGQMDALIEGTTVTLMNAATERKLQADEEARFVNRLDLGIGLFIVAVLGSVAVFGAVAISRPIRRIGEVLLELARGSKTSRCPTPTAATRSATPPAPHKPSRKS